MSLRFCMFTGICVVLALPFQVGDAATQDNLAECRLASTDSFSFKQCIGLQHQLSETLLVDIENRWREYLALESTQSVANGPSELVGELDPGADTSGTGNTNTNSPPDAIVPDDASDAVNKSGDPASVGKIIAIVNDETVSGSDSEGEVINISNQALLETDFPILESNSSVDLSISAQRARFETLAELYRQFRDQRCTWEASLYGADQLDLYITACNTRLNEERAKSFSQQLSEKRASDVNGLFFSGFYIEDDIGGIFQSCDRRQEWRITGDSVLLADIATRFDTIARDNLEMAYLEVRGDLGQKTDVSGLSGSLQVRSLNLLRAIDEADCSSTPTNTEINPPVPEELLSEANDVDSPGADNEAFSKPVPSDITVDALGASGFLYGYFANWVAACAVEQDSVCMAQADSGLSGQGDWRLVVDRSLEGQWRVKLIPTISDATIGRAINIEIDGSTASSRPVSSGGTAVQAEVGISLATGEPARLLVNQMRNGQNLSLSWSLPTEIGSELRFSLVGITRALDFFNQNR